MANHKSSLKRAKQDIKKNARNKAQRSAMKTAIRKTKAAIEEKNVTSAAELFKTAQSLIAKLGQSPVLKKKTSSRLISRLASQVKRLQA